MRSLLVCIACFACACETDDRPRTLAYVTEAILKPSCAQAQCHSTFTQAGGLIFDQVAASRRSMITNELAIYSVTPGDSGMSVVLTQGLPMGDDNDVIREPRNAPFPEQDIELITGWIATGRANGLGPVDAQCIPAPDDPTVGCDLEGRLVACDDGHEVAVIDDCTQMDRTCEDGVCSRL